MLNVDIERQPTATRARSSTTVIVHLVTKKPWLQTCSFLVCGLCAFGASCSTATAVRRCVRTGDAELCGNRAAGRIVLEAKGLKPGSIVQVSSAATGSTEFPVGADGHLAGTVGLIFPMAADTVVTVTASSIDGKPLVGEMTYPKP